MVQLFFKPSQSPLSLPTVLFSSLSLPLELLISLWSTVFLFPSLSLSISRFASPMRPPLLPCLPHHLFLCCYCLPHPLPFSFSLWSALRVLFIQQQPTQSRAEQNRAVKGGWLAKVGITSETQQNSSLLYSIYPYTTLFLSLHLITTLLYCAVHKIFNRSRAAAQIQNGALVAYLLQRMKIENIKHEAQQWMQNFLCKYRQ